VGGRERLTFPIVMLPVAMTEQKGELWRNKLLWLGFALAAALISHGWRSTTHSAGDSCEALRDLQTT